MKNDPTQSDLHELFEYRDGRLFWKTSRSNRTQIGDEAGYYCQNGYQYVNAYCIKVKRNRAVWIWHNGAIQPGLLVDHINQNKLDDRIENLRLATKSQNNFNAGRRKNAKTAHKGVRLRRDGKKWCARIMVDQREVHLGAFETEAEAVRAYQMALEKFAGEFRPCLNK